MSWTVRLEPQPSRWLQQLAATHPQLSDRVVAAIDLLKDLGPQAWSAAAAGDMRRSSAVKADRDGRKLVRFYFTDDPGQQIIHIVRVASPHRLLPACDVAFERFTGRHDDRNRIRFTPSLPERERHGRPPARPAPAADWLTEAAVRLLPAGERARYLEEFTGELWDMADAGASRWRRTFYGCRLLLGIWSLRAELAAPPRREAAG
jgi:hypothetical protein